MKKLLFVFLLATNFVFSQTTTEKYNTILERFEYFDNSGNMIGYKKYNSLSQQWEYFETATKNNPKANREYIKPFDFDLIDDSLKYKQSKYENNTEKIRLKIELVNKLFQLLSDYKSTPSISEKWSTISALNQSFRDGILKINNMKLDFSINSTTYEIINWIDQYEVKLTTIVREINQ